MGREVLKPFEVFTDVDGDPLEDGFVYIGQSGANPEVSPVSVFWDESLSIPAAQPIRTLGGYLSRNGAPARAYVAEDSYSITVRDKNGSLVYSTLATGVATAAGQFTFGTVASLRANAVKSLNYVATAGHTVAGTGPALYYFDAADTTTADDNFLCIVSDIDGGRWKLNHNGNILVEQAGARGDGVTADQAAFQKIVDAGLNLVFGRKTYAVTGSVGTSGAAGVQFSGNGATLLAAFTSDERFIEGTGAVGITIEGLTFDMNASVTGFGVHAISLQDPQDVTVRDCHFTDFVNFAVLFFTPDRGASGVAKNNHIIECTADGLGTATGGFGMESQAYSTIEGCSVTGVASAALGYAYNLKNVCYDSHVRGCSSKDSTWGYAISDDGAGGVGSGCNLCTVRDSTAINGTFGGLTVNKAKSCNFELVIDQANNNGGTDLTQHAGLGIQGFNVDCVYRVSISNVHTSQRAINVRSNDQTLVIERYDQSSTDFMNLDATTNRVRTHLIDYDTTSNTFNPQANVTDAGSNNEFINYRKFRNNLYIIDVAGEDLTDYQISGGTGLVNIRAGAVTAFTVDAPNTRIAPFSDNVFKGGDATRRYTVLYAVSGTINTSDEREKTPLETLTDAERACALELKTKMRKFKFLDAVEKKGAGGARWHFGVGAQTVASVFESHGLDPHSYGMFCYDEWEEEEEVFNNVGTVEQAALAAGNRYGVRYEELLCFIMGAI